MSLLTCADLIGREAERAQLDRALAAGRDGRATVALIGGEAGIGKSRLVHEVTRQATLDGWLVLEGGCLDLGDGALPLAPIVEMLRRLPDRLTPEATAEVLGPWRRELAALVPSLADGKEPPGESHLLRDGFGRLLEILLATFRRLAECQPTLLVFEDLHWADQSTRDLLAFLARNLEVEPVVLLATFRSDELHRRHPLRPVLADLQRSARPVRIDLERLDRAELDVLLRGVVGAAVAPDLVDEIWARSEGNPFFAEELVASGSRGRDLPPTVQDVLLARVERVSPQASSVLGIAAVAGRRVRHDLLAHLCGLDDDALSAALDELVAAHLLVAESDGFAFRHALVQEVAYEELLPGERTRLHLRMAESMSDECPTDASRPVHTAELAYHWYAAHRPDNALVATIEAARVAECVGALPESLHQHERALELWEEADDPAALAGLDHAELLQRAARVHLLLGTFSRARQLLNEALREMDETLDPVGAGLIYERLGRLEWDMDEADPLSTYEKAVALVPAEPPSTERAFVLAANGQILMLLGRLDESIDRCEEAVEVARAVGALQPEGHARNTRGTCLALFGQVDNGVDDLRAALAIAYEVDDPDDIGRAYVNLTMSFNSGARWHETLEVGYQGLEEVRRLGIDRTYGLYLRGNLVDALTAVGRWDEALEHEQTIAANRPESHWSYFTQGSLLAEMGRLDEARKVLDEAHVPTEGAAVFQGLAEHVTGVAALAIWEGRFADVPPLLDETLARLPEAFVQDRCGGLFWRTMWAAAELATRARNDGRSPADAIDTARSVAGHAEEMGARTGDHGSTACAEFLVHLELVRGELARAVGEPGIDLWRSALAATGDLGIVYQEAYCRYRLAEALLTSGPADLEEAGDLAHTALATLAHIGAVPLASEMRSFVANHGIEGLVTAPETPATTGQGGTALPAPEGAPALTPREREVLELVAEGLSNGQIGERLFISTKTASVHVSNILAKLGVSSRTEAAGVAIRAGLAPAAGP